MLSADYLDIAPEAIIALFQEYEQTIINDIARRLAGMDLPHQLPPGNCSD